MKKIHSHEMQPTAAVHIIITMVHKYTQARKQEIVKDIPIATKATNAQQTTAQ